MKLILQNKMKNKTIGLYILMIFAVMSMTTVSTVSADLPDLSKDSSGPTFTSEGTVNTMVGNNYTSVLGGNWNFQSINGITDSLSVDMTMVFSNGTDRHHMLITNFTQSEDRRVNMTQDGDININGTSDVYGHGKLKWSSVPSQVSIDKYNVLHVFVDNNQTEDHFKGGIHGIANTFTYGFNFDSESAKLH